MRTLLLFLIIITFYSCSNKPSEPITQTLTENWQFKQSDSTNWRSASVPGNVYSDLLHHKIIPNPFKATHELNVQWVSEKDWEYQTTFSLDAETLQQSHIELTFEGLDTYATIYLNDSLIGTTNNAFRKWNYDIKSLAKPNNILHVIFDAPTKQETIASNKLAYKLPESPRVFTRKAQFQYGWDWGPKLNTTGIWKPVKVSAWNTMKLEDVYFRQEKLNDSLAVISAEFTVTSDETMNDVFLKVNPENTTAWMKFTGKKGTHSYQMKFSIKNPKRWWTHNLGEPYLYHYNITLEHDGNIYGKQNVKLGLRTVELVTEKDEKGETFYFKLNGVPVFMKGANYIPQHSLQDQVTNTQYENLLNDVVDANMNMLRVWGGGIYENDVFYELCDEKGILVWQDFMFACAMYPSDENFLENVQQEAIDQVKRLRNHSSIALWCGNNENSEGWHRWGWQADKTEAQKEEIWNGYLAIFDSILPKTVAKLHPEVSYWESSPKYGRGNPKYQFEGDAHDWWVWHDAYPFEHFQQNVPRFMSEFGFQSFPSYETIRYFTEKDSIDLNHDSFITHQKHSRGFKLIREYIQRDYPVPTSGADYVYVSQLLQARGITMGIEAQRRAMPYCMGSLYWQLNDCWPVVSWSSIDFFGNWKALQYQVKKSFQEVLISSVIENDSVKTYIVSDKLVKQEGTLQLTFLDFKGTILHEKTENIVVPKYTSTLVFATALSNLKINPKNCVLKATFTNTSDSGSSSSSLYYLTKPKELQLPSENISTNVKKISNGFEITISAKTLQKDVFFYTKTGGHFSDNFFDILPNETVTITFETDADTLDDLAFKTLNGIQKSTEKK